MSSHFDRTAPQPRIRELDWLMLAVVGLCCLGLVMAVSIQSLAKDFDALLALKAQGSKLIVGAVLFVACAAVPMQLLRRHALTLFAFATLLVWAAAFFGPVRNNAHRWLSVGGMSFQPVDFARVTLIVASSALIAGAGARIREFGRGLCVVVAPSILLAAGLFLQPDNGNALLSMVIGGTMAIVAGVSFRWVGLGALVAVPIALLAVGRHGYALARVTRWWGEDPPYQVAQGLAALQTGGVTGAGIGSSWGKMGYVPEPQNDFVFTIIGEELGFLGSLAVVASFTLVGVVCYRLTRRLNDPFLRYVVFGCGFAVCAQAVINMLVTTGLAPAKGIDLPFVSAGGSNLVTSLGVVGLIGNAARSDLMSGGAAVSRQGGI